jgi:hypothetical protein
LPYVHMGAVADNFLNNKLTRCQLWLSFPLSSNGLNKNKQTKTKS